MSEAQTTAPLDPAAEPSPQEKYEAVRKRIRDMTEAAYRASGLAQGEMGEAGNG